MTIRLNVPDITCAHCVEHVTRAVTEADATARLQVDMETKIVSVESALAPEAIEAAIRSAGYSPAKVE